MNALARAWWWAFDRRWTARLMHRIGRHDSWCRGTTGLSCDPAVRPELWR